MKDRDEWTTAEWIVHLNRTWGAQATKHGYTPQVQPEDVPGMWQRCRDARAAA